MRGDEMTVSVEKKALMEKLLENRLDHEGQYNEAMDKYRQAVVDEMNRRILEIQAGGDVDTNFHKIVRPESYVDDYTTAIEMLRWHQSDVITLTRNEFKQYVLNEWDWQHSFARTTGSYTVR